MGPAGAPCRLLVVRLDLLIRTEAYHRLWPELFKSLSQEAGGEEEAIPDPERQLQAAAHRLGDSHWEPQRMAKTTGQRQEDRGLRPGPAKVTEALSEKQDPPVVLST
jgi:hypothetical protein